MFGTSGIRGEVGEDVTAQLALDVGRALASEGYDRVLIGRDARESGRTLADSVSAGLRDCGSDVVRAGVVTTPTLARGVGQVDAEAGVQVTASHNPASDNGLKLWTSFGQAFDDELRKATAGRVRTGNFSPANWQRHGHETEASGLHRHHREEIMSTVDIDESLSIVVDAGNGPGSFTTDVLDTLGCQVTTMNGVHDGSFPGRPSEPTGENCTDLCALVAETDADLGIAHDGDADRMVAVTDRGKIVAGDDLLALFARESAEEGDVVAAPLNTSLAVDRALSSVGATLSRTRVGDSHVAERVIDEGAVFGGEPSGAWIWPAETLCPDGPLAACRVAELVSEHGPLRSQLADLESYPTRRASVETSEKSDVIDQAADLAQHRYESVETTDGVRIETDDGWFLVRASGTQPLVRVTAEATGESRTVELFERANSLIRDVQNDFGVA